MKQPSNDLLGCESQKQRWRALTHRTRSAASQPRQGEIAKRRAQGHDEAVAQRDARRVAGVHCSISQVGLAGYARGLAVTLAELGKDTAMTLVLERRPAASSIAGRTAKLPLMDALDTLKSVAKSDSFV